VGKYGSRERRTAWGPWCAVRARSTNHFPTISAFGIAGGDCSDAVKVFNISRPSPSCGLSVRYSRSSVIFNRGLLRYAQRCELRLRSLFALLQNGQALRRSYGPLWCIGIPEWRETYQRQCEVVNFHSWSSLLRICTTSRESQARLPNAHPGPVSQLQTPPEELPPDPKSTVGNFNVQKQPSNSPIPTLSPPSHPSLHLSTAQAQPYARSLHQTT
jgi:hypothetical protein